MIIGSVRKWILRLFLFCGTLLFFNQSVSAQTLRQVIHYTVNTNPDIQEAARTRDATNQTVAQARSGYFPTVDVSAGIARERTLNSNTNLEYLTLWRQNLGVVARQKIFDGFETRYDVERTKSQTDADSFRVWSTAEDTALLGTEAYLDVLRNQELLLIAEENVLIHERTLVLVKHRGEQGVGRISDTAQTVAREMRSKANLVAVKKELENAKLTFLKITGLPAVDLEPPPDVPPVLIPDNAIMAAKLAVEESPLLRAATADVEASRNAYNVSKATLYPKVDAVIRADHDRNVGGTVGPNYSESAGLEMEYNLFRGGHDVAKIRETAYQFQKAIEVRNRTIRQVTDSMLTSWVAYRTARERLPLLIAHHNASVVTTRAYKTQFTLGQRTILDVLDSQDELYNSARDVVDARYELLFAKYNMLSNMGHLVISLGVALPCEAAIPFKRTHCYLTTVASHP